MMITKMTKLIMAMMKTTKIKRTNLFSLLLRVATTIMKKAQSIVNIMQKVF